MVDAKTTGTAPDRVLLENTLARLLQWISAADSKTGPVLAIDTAMLGALAALTPQPGKWTVLMALSAALTLTLLGVSIGYLFLAAYPRTKGPEGSLVFFGGIIEQQEEEFIDDILSVDPDRYARDLARQCYRNAEIAAEKFEHVKTATKVCLWAIAPWTLAIWLMYGMLS